MFCRKGLLLVLLAVWLVVPSGCATVPKEAVQLSYAVGNDIEQLYNGYRKTVVFSFQQMRERGLAVIDEQWTPIYLSEFIKSGQLVRFAQEENTAAVEYWARRAIRDIDNKRVEFLKPLEAQETALLLEIDDAFSRVIHANSRVSAHLNSVLKVTEMQNQVLDAAGLKETRDKINAGIVKASDFADELTKKIQDETGKLKSES